MTLSLELVVARVDGENRATVTGRVLRNGKPVDMPEHFWPVIIVNPPELVPDPLGDVPVSRPHPTTGEEIVMHRRDPDAAIRETVMHAAEAALSRG